MTCVNQTTITRSIIDAKKTFKSLISKYPDTEFATDAMFKINLILKYYLNNLIIFLF